MKIRASLFFALIVTMSSCGGDDDSGVGPDNLNCAASIIAFPANVSSTFPNSSCTVDGKQARFLKFTTSAGDVRFDVFANNDAFTPQLAVMKEGTTEFVSFDGAAGEGFGTWSLPAGTFVLRVIAASGTAGSFDIGGTNAPTGCLAHAVLSLATATYSNRIENSGNTTTGDCVFPDRNYDKYLVYSAKPCTITMRSTGNLDAQLSVANGATHALITSDDNSGGGKDAKVIMPSCRVGTAPLEITATASDLAPSSTGAYTLTIEITGGIAAQIR